MQTNQYKRAPVAAALRFCAGMLLAGALPAVALAAPDTASGAASGAQAADHPTGQTAGRRMHSTVRIVREVDKATPMSVATPGPGTGTGKPSGAPVKNSADGAAKGQATE